MGWACLAAPVDFLIRSRDKPHPQKSRMGHPEKRPVIVALLAGLAMRRLLGRGI
jgi:hypothetical protein